MSDPKKHHFIPQSILRHFLPDDENTFYCFNKRKGKTHRSTPKDIFFEDELYTKTSWLGGNSKSMEFELGRLESEIAECVRNFVERAQENTFSLSMEEKELWMKFLFVQVSRHPDQRENVKRDPGWYEDTMPRVKPDGTIIHPYARQYIQNPEIQKDIENEVRLRLIFDSGVYDRLKPIFDSKEVFAITINIPRKSFVIGDKGITRWPSGGSDLRDSDTRLLFPVRPDVIIAWGNTSATRKVETTNREEIRKLNQLTASQSEVIVGRNKALIDSLARQEKRR